MNKNIALVIHGGAGTISRDSMNESDEKRYRMALQNALDCGFDILKKNGSSLEAVEASVVALENNELFNAGRGSVFTHDETHEMDASIMCGNTLQAGSVSCITRIKNPIRLARTVMEKSDFVMISSKGAEQFANENGIEFAEPEYFYNSYRMKQLNVAKNQGNTLLDHHNDKKFGTVGAVAIDLYGNLAAATSTGGMTNKKYNRIGDTPIIGSGTYANNQTCAVSCTGHGEYFIRSVVAYDVSCLMEYKNYTLQQACETVVHEKLKKLGGEGGLIALDNAGNIEMCFNSEGMYRASIKNDEKSIIAIFA